ncbi:MAG: methyltransferase domain-containing protein [Deltaproteobacteria bacterium]|nr:MAG: methyltransferase domain-containing protein [Deltaproteobacteria bacterium]TMQ13213.1 MAG: methyltransferase domain-containing protein [Deltaproteobacteria bacterium]
MDLVLVCPGCRTRTADRIDLRTLEPRGDVLICDCGRRYPVVAGVPIVMADPSGYLRAEIATVVERDLPTDVVELLVSGGPDDASYPRLVEHLSIYLDAHWGDRAAPPPDGPGAGFGLRAIADRIAERAGQPVELAVELGCSTGRIVAELARGAERVCGLDLSFGAVRRARQLLDGELVEYPRRMIGRRYAAARVAAGDRTVAAERRLLVCGDALDPPLVPGVFGRVVALNLIDSVASPRGLLSVLDGLCAPGGEVILASPYAWQSSVMADHERLAGADPAAELTAILRDGTGLGARYQIEDEAELPWTLRRDARSAASYSIHYLRARKM